MQQELQEEHQEMHYSNEPHSHYEFNIKKEMVISHKGWFSIIWRAIDIFLCMSSSYIYIWFAVFGEHKHDAGHIYFQIFVEIAFAFSMYTKFTTDFIHDG